jgi:ubiquinone/menaquinone biosynthesis C-methylase UbiE
MTEATHTELRDYYARRAGEYDRVYAKPERQADLQALRQMLPPLFAGRHGLEIACGTGWWTPVVADQAASWLATDINEATLAIARARGLPPQVRLELADAHALAPLVGRGFDAVFAGFWWSHVPRARLAPWLAELHALLPSGARVAMIDNRFVAGSSTPIARIDADGNSWQRRTLADGSTHEVLKNFPGRDEAVAAIGPRAHAVQWTELPHFWLLHYELD